MRSAFPMCVRVAARVTLCTVVVTPVAIAGVAGLLAFALIALPKRRLAM
jgi:hypothetical protein